jgi:hypothetical protein
VAADTGYVASTSRNAVQLPENIERRLTLFRAGAALLVCALWGFFAFVKHTEMPIFMFLDIAVHEVGHMLFRPFGELVMLIMGSGWEVAFPFLMGIVFILWKRDFIAWGVCWAWSANSMADASRYIYDATRGELALLGGTGPDTMGDWERILGPEHLDKLYLTDRISADALHAGIVLWFIAMAIVIFGIVWNAKKLRDERPRARARPLVSHVPVAQEAMWR